jgi:hypothetical protein
VVERGFAWAYRIRLLACDCERLLEVLADLHSVAFVCLTLRRLIPVLLVPSNIDVNTHPLRRVIARAALVHQSSASSPMHSSALQKRAPLSILDCLATHAGTRRSYLSGGQKRPERRAIVWACLVYEIHHCGLEAYATHTPLP